MSEDDMGLPGPEDLGKMLHEAIQSVDLEKVEKQRRRAAEMNRLFPETAKFNRFANEALLIHTFLEHYLPTQGLTVARIEEDGTYSAYSEEDGAVSLIPKFFGVDPDALEAETPGVAAKVHEFESEDEVDNPDPLLAQQMDEFEKMLASVGEQEA
jgi:hypothetical protein